MIDGYFFKDPIPGYQTVGDRLNSAKKRVRKLKDHDRILFAQNQIKLHLDLYLLQNRNNNTHSRDDAKQSAWVEP